MLMEHTGAYTLYMEIHHSGNFHGPFVEGESQGDGNWRVCVSSLCCRKKCYYCLIRVLLLVSVWLSLDGDTIDDCSRLVE